MRRYDLTEEAALDLAEIASYTLKQWGPDQVRRYRDSLADAMEAIAAGTAVGRVVSKTPTWRERRSPR